MATVAATAAERRFALILVELELAAWCSRRMDLGVLDGGWREDA